MTVRLPMPLSPVLSALHRPNVWSQPATAARMPDFAEHNNGPQQGPGSPNISGTGYTPNLNYGMLWAYTDCLAKKGPILKSPADKFLVGADPVTGRNQQVDLAWEQLCLATGYELQIAKDQNFTLRIDPSVN